MYKVVKAFTDLQDDNYVYQVGATYPRKGVKSDTDRIAELSSKDNKIGEALIEYVKPQRKTTTKKKEK